MAAVSPEVEEPEEELLNLEPLLDRLEQVELRIDSIEHRPAPEPVQVISPEPPEKAAKAAAESAAWAAKLADLDRRVDENTRELTMLRQSVNDAERRISESVASMHRKVEETRKEIPALVDSSVDSRIVELGKRFAIEIEQSHQRTLETFERAIDEKISSRIGVIEKALSEQAGSIEALRVRATETDDNLQRLVSAIEKLCERAQLIAPVGAPEPPKPEPPPSRQPQFESQLHDAMRREIVKPTVITDDAEARLRDGGLSRPERPVPVPTFAGGPPKPAAAGPPKKSRFLFRTVLVPAFASLLASRVFWK